MSIHALLFALYKYGIPITHDAFEEKLALAIKEEKKLKEAGFNQTIWAGSTVEAEYEPEQDAGALREFMSQEYRAVSIDSALMEIIFEEATKMFDGTKTAEETAKAIQQRISDYISEK